jgi:hypothetical protein
MGLDPKLFVGGFKEDFLDTARNSTQLENLPGTASR